VSPQRLQVWLQKQRAGAHQAQLRWDSVAGPTIIATWELNELEHQGAVLILEAAQDHFDDLEQASRVRYECVIVDENGNALATKAVRVETIEREDRDESPHDNVRVEAASSQGLVSMLMRHTEVRARIETTNTQIAFRILSEALRDQRDENRTLRLENRQLRARVRNTADDPEQSEALQATLIEESETRKAAIGKVLDIAAQATPYVLEHFTRRRGDA